MCVIVVVVGLFTGRWGAGESTGILNHGSESEGEGAQKLVGRYQLLCTYFTV